MKTLNKVLASDIRPGDVVCLDQPDFDMPVRAVGRTPTGNVKLYSTELQWNITRMPGELMQVWVEDPSIEEENRPFDWQDKLVIGASIVTSIICLVILGVTK